MNKRMAMNTLLFLTVLLGMAFLSGCGGVTCNEPYIQVGEESA